MTSAVLCKLYKRLLEMKNSQKKDLVCSSGKIESYPQKKHGKALENKVIHEVIHNIHKKVPQVWYSEMHVKFESLFWNL